MAFLTSRFPAGINRRTWLFYVIGFAVLLLVIVAFDRPISVAAQAMPEPFHGFFAWITDFGRSDWILWPSLVLFVVTARIAWLIRAKPKPRRALAQMALLYAFIFLAVGLPSLLANVIKRIVGRARPELFDTVGSFGFERFSNDWTYQSFVSGHATTIFAFATVVGFLSARWYPPALLLAILVGISRVVVGAHYPSDVFGGVVVGTLGAFAVRNVFASRRWLFEGRPDGSLKLRPFAAVNRLVRTRGRTTR